MNDRPSDRELDDQTIERLFSSLRQLEPPLESRVAHRAAVAAEITRLTRRRRERALPFWRRTVVLPWPAAAVAVLIMISLMSFQSSRRVSPTGTSGVVQEEIEPVDQPISTEVTSVAKTPTLAYHETTTYLCGIGPLRSEAKYILEE